MQVVGGHAGGDAHLHEEVEGITHLVDEVLVHRELLGLLPRLELELLHGFAQFADKIAEEFVDPRLHLTVVEVTLHVRGDDRRAVGLLDGVILRHEVLLALEDHLQGVDLRQLSEQSGALPIGVLVRLLRNERLRFRSAAEGGEFAGHR